VKEKGNIYRGKYTHLSLPILLKFFPGKWGKEREREGKKRDPQRDNYILEKY